MNKFKCGMCGGVFNKGWTEEEALEELKEYFGDVLVEDCDMVCDDCWELIKPEKLDRGSFD